MSNRLGSGQHPPLEACLKEVSEPDVLVAHRYGWVPDEQRGDQHKSIDFLRPDARWRSFGFRVARTYP